MQLGSWDTPNGETGLFRELGPAEVEYAAAQTSGRKHTSVDR